jgi:hypothetical protein
MNQWLILLLMILPASEAPDLPAEATQKSVAASQTAPAPEAVVTDFYRWYIDRLNRDKDPLRQEKTTLRRYISPEFLRKAPKLLEQTNADVFICAQDWDEDWGKNANVSRLNIQGAAATLTVTLTGKTIQKHRLQVKLRQVNGVWKIDKIDPLDR